MPGSGDVFVSMGGGAWPCVVGEVLGKVGSFTNKELNLPIFYTEPRLRSNLVEGIVAVRETSLLLWVVAHGHTLLEEYCARLAPLRTESLTSQVFIRRLVCGITSWRGL